MEVIKIGDKLKVKYSLKIGNEVVREYDESELIIGNKSNIGGINRFLNKFIGEKKKSITGLRDTIVIEPELGYGLTDKSKIGAIPKELMNSDVRVGDNVDLSFKDGSVVQGLVKSENDDTFIVDCNHPLVNKELIVDIEIIRFI